MKNNIDFEMTEILAGKIEYWSEDGESVVATAALMNVLDYIEHHGLNQDVWTSNPSWDGNPTHEVDHEYTHDPLDYLKDNIAEVSKLYYQDHLAAQVEGKEAA